MYLQDFEQEFEALIEKYNKPDFNIILVAFDKKEGVGLTICHGYTDQISASLATVVIREKQISEIFFDAQKLVNETIINNLKNQSNG